MNKAEKTTTEKKTYIQPQIAEVKLVPAEAVLGVCKTGTNINACFPFVQCAAEIGS